MNENDKQVVKTMTDVLRYNNMYGIEEHIHDVTINPFKKIYKSLYLDETAIEDHHLGLGVFNTIDQIKKQIQNDPFTDSRLRVEEYIRDIVNDELSSFIADYHPHSIKKYIQEMLDGWNELAILHNIDINDVTESIKGDMSKFNRLEEFKIFSKEVEEIIIKGRRLTVQYREIQLNTEQADNSEKKDYQQKYENLRNYVNDPERVINRKGFETFGNMFNYFEINNTLENIRQKIIKISDRIINETGMVYTDAFKYRNMSVNPEHQNINNFLKNKEVENEFADSIEFKHSFDKHPKYKEFLIFYDTSILVKTNNNEIIVPHDTVDTANIIKDILKGYIDLSLNKNPTVSKHFKNILSKNYYDTTSMMITLDNFHENKDILKNCKFDFSGYESFEQLNDKIAAVIIDQKVKQFAHSIVSNKYLHLYDEKSYEIFKEIYNEKIASSVLQEMIGKKLAVYKSPEEFNIALTKLLDSFNDFSMDAMLYKAKTQQAEIVSQENNQLILKINSFEQSQSLGSPSWCISRDKHYYKSYTSDDANQYFIYDFNKISTDNSSLIGLTLYNDGKISTAHYKNDDPYTTDDFMRKIALDIISKTLENYPQLNHSLRIQLSYTDVVKVVISSTKNSIDFTGYPR